jgi:hypothetical protein
VTHVLTAASATAPAMLGARRYGLGLRCRLGRLPAPSERLANIAADGEIADAVAPATNAPEEHQQALHLRHWMTEAHGDVLTAAVAGVSNAGADVLPGVAMPCRRARPMPRLRLPKRPPTDFTAAICAMNRNRCCY